MDSRVAIMAIIVENGEAVSALNALLHEFSAYIISRMGIPYRKRGINIISVALDAPQSVISAVSGRMGNIRGVSVKTVMSSVGGPSC